MTELLRDLEPVPPVAVKVSVHRGLDSRMPPIEPFRSGGGRPRQRRRDERARGRR